PPMGITVSIGGVQSIQEANMVYRYNPRENAMYLSGGKPRKLPGLLKQYHHLDHHSLAIMIRVWAQAHRVIRPSDDVVVRP
ncbi:hypothetical protein, partial [Thiolapillus sp.]